MQPEDIQRNAKVTDWSQQKTGKRDITLLPLTPGQSLVIACDSCGGVGQKPADLVQVPPEITGKYTCRVAAMEVLAVGASIRLVIDTLAVEWEPTGQRIMEGIHQCLEEAGLEKTVALNGSTEENFPMTQTAMGITVIGEVSQERFLSGISEENDWVVTVGIPKVGNEITHPLDKEVVSLTDFITLRNTTGVKDIIPVGSKGIGHEARLLGHINGLQVVWHKPLSVDIHKSGGPATCAVAAMTQEAYETLVQKLSCPMQPIGRLGR